MALETLELDKLMQQYSISELRNIPEYVKLCECYAVGLNTIQNAVNYLSNMIDVYKSEGVWLDNIGNLVGALRGKTIDLSQYFCVNSEHVNVPKRFYFPNISTSGVSSLDDALYQGQIKAKIAYNNSNGTREDYIRIIKPLVNADKVIIENYAPMQLKISLYGENIITDNIKQRIENVLQDGISIYGDITIYKSISYETIESEINTIVEMSNISEIDPNYEYIDIDKDLDYILEIE